MINALQLFNFYQTAAGIDLAHSFKKALNNLHVDPSLNTLIFGYPPPMDIAWHSKPILAFPKSIGVIDNQKIFYNAILADIELLPFCLNQFKQIIFFNCFSTLAEFTEACNYLGTYLHPGGQLYALLGNKALLSFNYHPHHPLYNTLASNHYQLKHKFRMTSSQLQIIDYSYVKSIITNSKLINSLLFNNIIGIKLKRDIYSTIGGHKSQLKLALVGQQLVGQKLTTT